MLVMVSREALSTPSPLMNILRLGVADGSLRIYGLLLKRRGFQVLGREYTRKYPLQARSMGVSFGLAVRGGWPLAPLSGSFREADQPPGAGRFATAHERRLASERWEPARQGLRGRRVGMVWREAPALADPFRGAQRRAVPHRYTAPAGGGKM